MGKPMPQTRFLSLPRLLLTVAAVSSLGAGTLVWRGGTQPGAPLSGEPAATEQASSQLAAALPGERRKVRPAEEPAPDPDEPRILVSLQKRRLWFVRGGDTLFSAPVAIGKGEDFVFEGKKFHFATPRGQRRILAKATDPVWIPPDWHYYEKAAKRRLEVVKLNKDDKIELADGSFIVVMGDSVGRVNQNGYFAAFTPGNEIIFDNKIFVPPLSSAQRRVPDALGPYKLDMGEGYLIHGTHMYNEDSIGQAVSHGCVRMENSDLERLYRLVPRGTSVEIF